MNFNSVCVISNLIFHLQKSKTKIYFNILFIYSKYDEQGFNYTNMFIKHNSRKKKKKNGCKKIDKSLGYKKWSFKLLSVKNHADDSCVIIASNMSFCNKFVQGCQE